MNSHRLPGPYTCGSLLRLHPATDPSDGRSAATSLVAVEAVAGASDATGVAAGSPVSRPPPQAPPRHAARSDPAMITLGARGLKVISMNLLLACDSVTLRGPRMSKVEHRLSRFDRALP